jgi:tripartite-type tricarboxylate transporter receptor subunit TctC
MRAPGRVRGAADVPTIAEAGGPGLSAASWLMFLAPKGTPPAVVERLSSAASAALAAPDVRVRLDQLAVAGVGGGSGAAAAFLGDEIEKWRGIIDTASIKGEP